MQDFDSDPDLHLVVNGKRIEPISVEADTYLFGIDESAEIFLASKSIVMAKIGICRDFRRLGVAIQRYWIEDEGVLDVTAFHSPALADGFHEAERAAGIQWTNGLATVVAKVRQGAVL